MIYHYLCDFFFFILANYYFRVSFNLNEVLGVAVTKPRSEYHLPCCQNKPCTWLIFRFSTYLPSSFSLPVRATCKQLLNLPAPLGNPLLVGYFQSKISSHRTASFGVEKRISAIAEHPPANSHNVVIDFKKSNSNNLHVLGPKLS